MGFYLFNYAPVFFAPETDWKQFVMATFAFLDEQALKKQAKEQIV